MRPITSLALLALTSLGFATTACSATYAFVPATHATSSLYGHAAADYAIPPQSPHGQLRVASYGVEPLSPAESPDEEVAALHVRVSVSNTGAHDWTVDTREQQVRLEGHATSTPAFSTASPGTSAPPVLSIAPQTTRLVDLFFPLPEDMQTASTLPAFQVTSTVHTDAGPVSETTPFARIETDADSPYAQDYSAPQADYDPALYGYDYWDSPFYYNPTFIGFYGGIAPRGYWGRPFYARGWGWGGPGYYHGWHAGFRGGYRGGPPPGGFRGGGFHGGGGGGGHGGHGGHR
jgi:hypothetical protein